MPCSNSGTTRLLVVHVVVIVFISGNELEHTIRLRNHMALAVAKKKKQLRKKIYLNVSHI